MKMETILGHPIKCYDDGKGADHFTIVFLDLPEGRFNRGKPLFAAIGCSALPFHPQGFGQHCTAMVGRHLGKRVRFSSLPVDVRKFVNQDLTAY